MACKITMTCLITGKHELVPERAISRKRIRERNGQQLTSHGQGVRRPYAAALPARTVCHGLRSSRLPSGWRQLQGDARSSRLQIRVSKTRTEAWWTDDLCRTDDAAATQQLDGVVVPRSCAADLLITGAPPSSSRLKGHRVHRLHRPWSSGGSRNGWRRSRERKSERWGKRSEVGEVQGSSEHVSERGGGGRRGDGEAGAVRLRYGTIQAGEVVSNAAVRLDQPQMRGHLQFGGCWWGRMWNNFGTKYGKGDSISRRRRYAQQDQELHLRKKSNQHKKTTVEEDNIGTNQNIQKNNKKYTLPVMQPSTIESSARKTDAPARPTALHTH